MAYACELTFTVFSVSFELVVAATFTLVLVVSQIDTPVFTAAILYGARVDHWKRATNKQPLSVFLTLLC